MALSLTVEESKALLALCRAGKLYGIERWISAGKPTVIDPSLRKTALLTAVETGFHSLVELVAQHEPRQEEKDRALAQAVKRKRLDMVEVLVEHGASAVIFFLELGAPAPVPVPTPARSSSDDALDRSRA